MIRSTKIFVILEAPKGVGINSYKPWNKVGLYTDKTKANLELRGLRLKNPDANYCIRADKITGV